MTETYQVTSNNSQLTITETNPQMLVGEELTKVYNLQLGRESTHKPIASTFEIVREIGSFIDEAILYLKILKIDIRYSESEKILLRSDCEHKIYTQGTLEDIQKFMEYELEAKD